METFSAGSKREVKQALVIAVAGEIIRSPEIAAARGMALDQPIVLTDAGFLKRRALRDKVGDVGRQIDTLILRKLRERGTELEQVVIQRRL